MTLAFVGGNRWSAGSGRVPNRSVVIEGGRIRALDTDPPHGASVMEVGPRLLVPGFIDAHVHPLMAGHRMRTCDLTGIDDLGAALTHIEHHALSLPPDGWLTGGGWLYPWFEGGCPPASLLDRLVGGRRAVLDVRDGHSSWASSAALAAAGIGPGTPDPPDGRIERSADGRPQGTLHEGAMRLVDAVVPAPSDEEADHALQLASTTLLGHGVTSWHDAWVTDAEHDAWRRRAGGPSVTGALWWDRERGPEQTPELLERIREVGPGYRPTAVKLMLDGVCENLTASMTDPYLDVDGRPSDDSGIDFIDPGLVAEVVPELDRAGLQCHFHAIGDRAVRSALDAVAVARERNGWGGPLHHIAHLQVVDPGDIPRFAGLRVAANCQPVWACNEEAVTEMTVPRIGAERASWMYPFGSIERSGGLLAMGSDWPVSTPSVMDQVSVAVRRRPPSDDATPALDESEGLTLHRALTAFTRGSAVVSGHRDRGRLRVGDVGDVVVLDADPFQTPDPAGIGVAVTVVAGLVVVDRDGRAAATSVPPEHRVQQPRPVETLE